MLGQAPGRLARCGADHVGTNRAQQLHEICADEAACAQHQDGSAQLTRQRFGMRAHTVGENCRHVEPALVSVPALRAIASGRITARVRVHERGNAPPAEGQKMQESLAEAALRDVLLHQAELGRPRDGLEQPSGGAKEVSCRARSPPIAPDDRSTGRSRSARHNPPAGGPTAMSTPASPSWRRRQGAYGGGGTRPRARSGRGAGNRHCPRAHGPHGRRISASKAGM